jgi:hypothetical protein
MPRIHFGFCMPADQLDKQRRATFSADLNRALELITGHFDSAWIIDHLQFGTDDMLEGFTALSYMAALLCGARWFESRADMDRRSSTAHLGCRSGGGVWHPVPGWESKRQPGAGARCGTATDAGCPTRALA